MKNYFHILIIAVFCFSFSASAQWTEMGGAPLNNLNLFDGLPRVICRAAHCDKGGNIYVYVEASDQNIWSTLFSVLMWDGSTWQNLGDASLVYSIIKANNGVLYALNQHIAQYGGNSDWYEVGGQNALQMNMVFSMCVDSTGNLYAGSYGTSVAKWNNSQWLYLPSINSQTGTAIAALCSDGNGNIYAASNFTNANGNLYVAKWNGNSWTELVIDSLSSQLPNQLIGYLTADNQGNIYAAGTLRTVDNKYYVAKWNGTTWQKLIGSNGLPNGVGADGSGISPAMSVDKYGNVYVVCAGSSIHKWNGSDWINMTANDFHFYYNPAYQPTIRITGICTDTSGNLYASLYSFSDGIDGTFNAKAYVLKYSKAYEVGIEELANENLEVKIYPNPASEIINVSLSPALSKGEGDAVCVYDMLGKEVIQTKFKTHNFQIDVSSLAKGLYIAELRGEGRQVKRVKIVKE